MMREKCMDKEVIAGEKVADARQKLAMAEKNAF